MDDPACDINTLIQNNKDLILLTGNYLNFFGKLYYKNKSKDVEEITDPESVTATIESIASQKKTKDLFLGFYINGDGYLDSWDPTTSWRLDIWQDLYYYMIDEKIIFFGHGYKEIFPITPLAFKFICVPIIGWVPTFDNFSENSNAPHKL